MRVCRLFAASAGGTRAEGATISRGAACSCDATPRDSRERVERAADDGGCASSGADPDAAAPPIADATSCGGATGASGSGSNAGATGSDDTSPLSAVLGCSTAKARRGPLNDRYTLNAIAEMPAAVSKLASAGENDARNCAGRLDVVDGGTRAG